MGIYQTISVEHQSSVTTLRLNRPEVRNAFNTQMMLEIAGVISSVRTPETRLIIITAHGPDFCSGADLTWMTEAAGNLEEARKSSSDLFQMYSAIRSSPVPVVTRVFGRILAGGVGLCAASDIVYADPTSVFSISEARVGLIPAVMSPFVVERTGLSRFRELTLTGRVLDAQEAQRIGLADFVLPPKEREAAFQRSLRDILSNGPEALAAVKALCRELSRYDWDTEGQNLVALIAERRCSTEGKEGIRAFLEKREPVWRTHD